MKLWTGDGLLLHQQAGANFNLTANPKRIDALVAHGLHGVGPDHLPVIILRSLVHGLHRLSVDRETEQVELAISTQIGYVKHHCWSRGMIEQNELTVVIAEPNQGVGYAGIGRRRRRSQKQIERSVIVEISHVQSDIVREIGGGIRDSGNLRRLPAFSIVFTGDSKNGAIRLHYQQIEHAVVVGVGDRDRLYDG